MTRLAGRSTGCAVSFAERGGAGHIHPFTNTSRTIFCCLMDSQKIRRSILLQGLRVSIMFSCRSTAGRSSNQSHSLALLHHTRTWHVLPVLPVKHHDRQGVVVVYLTTPGLLCWYSTAVLHSCTPVPCETFACRLSLTYILSIASISRLTVHPSTDENNNSTKQHLHTRNHG